jgi:hypothetical protein
MSAGPCTPALMRRLKQHLLRFGGTEFQSDGYLYREVSRTLARALLEVREARSGNVRQVRGLPNEGLANSLAWANLNPGTTVMTGLALSDDGIWRLHAWCIARNGELIETTVERRAYVGVPREEIEAAAWRRR